MEKAATYQDKFNRYLFWYVFLVVFPAILIFQNLSFYFFLLLFVTTIMHQKPVRMLFLLQWVAVLFGLAAIFSVLDVNVNRADAQARANLVLPNYLYWVLIILFLVTHRAKLRLDIIYKAVFFAVLCSVVYYFLLQRYLSFFPFTTFTQNSFAFLIICYAPIAVFYAHRRYGFFGGLILSLILTVCAFLGGSRAGSILTFCGVLLTLLFDKMNFKMLIVLAVLGFFLGNAILQMPIIKNTVRALNSETYDLVYDTDNIMKSDRSYLVRVAMVEKGLELFKKHPLTGIGLNNFANIKVKIPGEFEGAKWVKNKNIFETKSAHNSYVGLLAEGGLLLIIPFLILLLGCILYFFRHGVSMPGDFRPVFIGILCMSVHLYFIMAIVNVFAWLLLGLGIALIYRNKK